MTTMTPAQQRAQSLFSELNLEATLLIEELRINNGRAYAPLPIDTRGIRWLAELPAQYMQGITAAEPAADWTPTVLGAAERITQRVARELGTLAARAGSTPAIPTLRAINWLIARERAVALAEFTSASAEANAALETLKQQKARSTPTWYRRAVEAQAIVQTWNAVQEHGFRRDRSRVAATLLSQTHGRIEQLVEMLVARSAHYAAAAATLEAERNSLAAKAQPYLDATIVDEPFQHLEIARALAMRAQPAAIDPRARTTEAIIASAREHAAAEATRVLSEVTFSDLIQLDADISGLLIEQAHFALQHFTVNDGANKHAFVPVEGRREAGDRLLILAAPGGHEPLHADALDGMSIRSTTPEVDLDDRLTAIELVGNVDFAVEAAAIRDAFAALEREFAAGRPRALLPELLQAPTASVQHIAERGQATIPVAAMAPLNIIETLGDIDVTVSESGRSPSLTGTSND